MSEIGKRANSNLRSFSFSSWHKADKSAILSYQKLRFDPKYCTLLSELKEMFRWSFGNKKVHLQRNQMQRKSVGVFLKKSRFDVSHIFLVTNDKSLTSILNKWARALRRFIFSANVCLQFRLRKHSRPPTQFIRKTLGLDEMMSRPVAKRQQETARACDETF